ncbi:hypothetical protein QAD02_017144 [Eretmocerus hayati]|uniref:Uncharacterized protein n=1 Tax=Eretmocerus hayati TaxID=131215 RepID=A0ACC2PFY6_9HYME|nr:hypothetical protein QAD02_017144 [Eretmocerus hayati]
MDYDYLVFLYFATIIFPALLIAAFYAHIYRVVVKQLQQIVTMNPVKRVKEPPPPPPQQQQSSIGNHNRGKHHHYHHHHHHEHGTMLRLLGAAQKREVKATQNLSRIVIFFIICWFPLYTINCINAFCPKCEVSGFLLNACIILSHVNSAGNPLLYAYHLKDFRAALKSFIHRLIFTSRADGDATATMGQHHGRAPGRLEKTVQGTGNALPGGPSKAGNKRVPGLALVQQTSPGSTFGGKLGLTATGTSLRLHQQQQMRSVVDLMSVHALPQRLTDTQRRTNRDPINSAK